jgi:Leucine-rich repeat (LRR) protein
VRMNRLTTLPASFTQLTALRRVDLSYNALTTLPEDFGSLVNLQEIFITDNQLAELPYSLVNLTGVWNFDVSGNPLPMLDDVSWQSIEDVQAYLREDDGEGDE